LINADGCPVHVEVAGPERAPVPPVIIGRDDRGRDEPASETIGRHSVSEIGCDGTTRCAASLDAALDVRAQRLSPAAAFTRLILACSGLPSLTPRALAAASAWRVRSPITCRSCSAAAASTVLLTTEIIRALFDNIRGEKDRIIDGEVMKKDDDDG
jgi:hypothetical protein